MPRFEGKLIPKKFTTAERDLITSPTDKEIIFNTDTDGYQYYHTPAAEWRNFFVEGQTIFIPPSQIGGGASSMVITFASGSLKHVETTSGTYVNLAHMIYGGSDAVGTIAKININAWVNAASTGDIRLVCKATGLTIGEFTGISSMDEANIFDLGTLSNIPTTASVIEIQGRRTSGGGSSKLRIGSLELEY